MVHGKKKMSLVAGFSVCPPANCRQLEFSNEHSGREPRARQGELLVGDGK